MKMEFKTTSLFVQMVGHRGSGKWRRSDKIENVLENTIASFNYAAKNVIIHNSLSLSLRSL